MQGTGHRAQGEGCGLKTEGFINVEFRMQNFTKCRIKNAELRMGESKGRLKAECLFPHPNNKFVPQN